MDTKLISDLVKKPNTSSQFDFNYKNLLDFACKSPTKKKVKEM